MITVQPANAVLPVGGSAGLSVMATGPGLTYQWRKDRVDLPGATDAMLTLPDLQPADNGRYSVVVGNGYGSVTSADALVTAVAITPPQSRTVTAGDSVALTVSVQSVVPLAFRWAHNGAQISGATSSTLTLNNVQLTDAGTYTVGIATADWIPVYPVAGPGALSATLTVVPRAIPAVSQQPLGGSVDVGGTFVLSVTALGDGFTYQWQKNGVPIPNESGPTLVLGNAQPADAGDYRVVLLTANGPIYSNVAHVEVVSSRFAGTYWCTLTNGDSIALQVRPDGRADILGILWERGQIVVARDVAVLEGGEFSFGGQHALSDTATSVSARFYTGAVIGGIADGRVNGMFDDLNVSFSGTRSTTSGEAPSGFYQAVPLAADLGEIDAIAGPDGQVLLAAIDGAGVRGGYGRVDSSGAFSVVQAGSYEYRGAIGGSAGTLQGVYVPATGDQVLFASTAAPTSSDRLVNVSTRGLTSPGAGMLTAGFVITGGGAKDVLVRAVGPGLADFGVSGTLTNPRLRLFKDGVPIMENDDWGLGGFSSQIADAVKRVGAFTLAGDSADAALLAHLAPGAYTAQISGDTDASGVALVEVYDAGASEDAGTKLLNVSTRGEVGAGGDLLIVGFVVHGTSAKKLLIRGIGPALAGFGVAGSLPDPKLQVYQDQTLIQENDDWSETAEVASVAAAADSVGAFGLPPGGSKDAALLLYLGPGTYTAQVSGVGGANGIALVEVYEVP